MVRLETTADRLFAGEFHFSITEGVVEVVDADGAIPGTQIGTPGSALANKIGLRLPVIGFPDNGGDTRSCLPDSAGRTGDDSVYTFIKGSGDVPLQLLSQHWKAEWGNNWCGPTAAGISLGWFAETAAGDDAHHANLIEDPGNDGVDSGDKYAAIGTLGMMMGTSSGSGTTDGNFVQGLFNYINSRGLTGDFIIKTFNDPDFWDYSNELSTGEDVLVGITYGSGDGHWLVGRSFSDALNNNGTSGDPLDDYFLVSFVDPGTASVYHTKMRVVDWAIWYMGEWVNFDIMVSVSPTPPGFEPNPGSAQYFIAQNRVGSSGDFTFTLLGDVDPASPHHRTTELTGDANGRIFLARITLRALAPGVATISFVSPDGTADAVNLVMIDGSGDPVLYPPSSLGTPAATIIVGGGGAVLEVRVKLQGPQRTDPTGFEMPLVIKLFNSGDDVLAGAQVATYSCAKMVREAPWAVCRVSVQHSGQFDVAVESTRTLVHVKRGASALGTVDFVSPLIEGNLIQSTASERRSINFQDFTAWLSTWKDKCSVDPPTSIAHYSPGDLDKNCKVNLQDFTLFLINYAKASPQEES